MSCEKIGSELIGYHFGTLSEETRQAVEAHLPTCAGCVREFVALKRDLELAEREPAPSQRARDRLRRAVAHEVLREKPVARWGWWERPLALGGALAVLLGAAAITRNVSLREGRPPQAISHDGR
jgi:anti-sigma factor RsiW